MKPKYYLDLVTKPGRRPLLTIRIPWPFYKLIWSKWWMERSK